MDTPTYVVKRIGDRYVTMRDGGCGPSQNALRIGGGALLLYMGLTRAGLLGVTAFVAGAGLIVKGISAGAASGQPDVRGHAPVGRPSQTPSYQNDFKDRATQLPADVVDEQSMESFPASDAPARTGTRLSG